MIIDALYFKQVGILTPILQIILIVLLFCIAILTQYSEYIKTGKTYGRYPFRISTFLSSIYEEIIFRGIVLFGLAQIMSPVSAVAIASLLFGLWHVKNYRWQTRSQTMYQVSYTGLIFGPIMAIISLWTGTIWIAVILHYIHNILADLMRKRKVPFL
jgi:membrane protease YdiL (CAAX protease family)